MSNDNTTVPPTAPAGVPTDAPTEVKRPNVVVRTFRAIKNDPKTTLAVVAGVGLVAGSAFLGRKTAPLHIEIVESPIELEPVIVNATLVEDTTVSA